MAVPDEHDRGRGELERRRGRLIVSTYSQTGSRGLPWNICTPSASASGTSPGRKSRCALAELVSRPQRSGRRIEREVVDVDVAARPRDRGFLPGRSPPAPRRGRSTRPVSARSRPCRRGTRSRRSFALDCREHRLERVQVRVDVRDDGDAHRARAYTGRKIQALAGMRFGSTMRVALPYLPLNAVPVVSRWCLGIVARLGNAELPLPARLAVDERLVVNVSSRRSSGLSPASSTPHSRHGTVTGSSRSTSLRRALRVGAGRCSSCGPNAAGEAGEDYLVRLRLMLLLCAALALTVGVTAASLRRRRRSGRPAPRVTHRP